MCRHCASHPSIIRSAIDLFNMARNNILIVMFLCIADIAPAIALILIAVIVVYQHSPCCGHYYLLLLVATVAIFIYIANSIFICTITSVIYIPVHTGKDFL